MKMEIKWNRRTRRMTGKMGFWLFCLTFLSSLVIHVQSVKITELRVPQTVLNGTTEPLILDCDYVLEDDETPKGVVVKWFFNRGSSPVYQWVYGRKPQGLGILRDRLNLDYMASEEDWAAHRALSIKNPTTELSGEWLCRVSTFEKDAMKTSKMIVFAPQKEMDIRLVSRPSPDSINISCWATGVFPEPKLTISYDSYQLTDVITDSTWNDGAYDVVVHKVLEDTELSAHLPVIFDCELKIPNTSYIHRKNLLYAGPIMKDTLESNSASLQQKSGTLFLTNLIFIAWFLFRWT